MTMKTCTTCESTLPLDRFHSRGKNQGRRSVCKECVSIASPRKSKVDAYLDLPLEFRRKNYTETIHKMVGMGIMSETYAKGALARVESMGK